MMATIRPRMDLREGTMTLESPRCGRRRLVVSIRPLDALRSLGMTGRDGDPGGSRETAELWPRRNRGPGPQRGWSCSPVHRRPESPPGACSQKESSAADRASGRTASSRLPDLGKCYDEADSSGSDALSSSETLSVQDEGAHVQAPAEALKDSAPPTGRGPEGSRGTSLMVCGDSVCGWLMPEGDMRVVDGDVLQCSSGLSPGQSASDPDPDPSRQLDQIQEWFRQAVGRPCRLVRQAQGERHASGRRAGGGQASNEAHVPLLGLDGISPSSSAPLENGISSPLPPPSSRNLGFANDGQFMLLNAASLSDLASRMAVKGGRQRGVARGAAALEARQFRPNLVVGGFEAYAEDNWGSVQVCRASCHSSVQSLLSFQCAEPLVIPVQRCYFPRQPASCRSPYESIKAFNT